MLSVNFPPSEGVAASRNSQGDEGITTRIFRRFKDLAGRVLGEESAPIIETREIIGDSSIVTLSGRKPGKKFLGQIFPDPRVFQDITRVAHNFEAGRTYGVLVPITARTPHSHLYTMQRDGGGMITCHFHDAELEFGKVYLCEALLKNDLISCSWIQLNAGTLPQKMAHAKFLYKNEAARGLACGSVPSALKPYGASIEFGLEFDRSHIRLEQKKGDLDAMARLLKGEFPWQTVQRSSAANLNRLMYAFARPTYGSAFPSQIDRFSYTQDFRPWA